MNAEVRFTPQHERDGYQRQPIGKSRLPQAVAHDGKRYGAKLSTDCEVVQAYL
jgi:hypothetical protein